MLLHSPRKGSFLPLNEDAEEEFESLATSIPPYADSTDISQYRRPTKARTRTNSITMSIISAFTVQSFPTRVDDFGGVPRNLEATKEVIDMVFLSFPMVLATRAVRSATLIIIPYYLHAKSYIGVQDYNFYCLSIAIPILFALMIRPVSENISQVIGYNNLFSLLSIIQITGCVIMLLQHSFWSFLFGYILLMTMTGEKNDTMKYISYFTSSSRRSSHSSRVTEVFKVEEAVLYFDICGAFIGPFLIFAIVALGQKSSVINTMWYFLVVILGINIVKFIASTKIPYIPPSSSRMSMEGDIVLDAFLENTPVSSRVHSVANTLPTLRYLSIEECQRTIYMEWKVTLGFLMISTLISFAVGFLDIAFALIFMFSWKWSLLRYSGLMTIVAGTSQIPALLKTLLPDALGKKPLGESSTLLLGTLVHIAGVLALAFEFIIFAIIACVVGQVFSAASIQSLTSKILTSKRQRLINLIAFYLAPAVGAILNVPLRTWENPREFIWLVIPLTLSLLCIIYLWEWCDPQCAAIEKLRVELAQCSYQMRGHG